MGERTMRNVVLALLAVALGPATLPAQTSWAEKLFKEGTSHDFGTVPRGTQLFYSFPLTNIYKVPLEITIRIGCHCVTATPSVRVLQSQQSGSIDITMDASRFTGYKNVKIYVTVSNGSEYLSTATLQVTATSRVDVVLNPGQINFGIVARGQPPPAQVLDVEYAGILPWQITEIVAHTAPLEATAKELYRRPGQVGYRLTVALRPDVPAGPFKHELYLKTNDPAVPVVPVLVEAMVQASLSVIPSTVNMGTLRTEEFVVKKVLIRGSKPFRVLAVEGTGDGVTTEPLPTAPRSLQVVLIRCQPTKPGPLKRQLVIKTDLDQEGPATVQVEAMVEP